MERALLSFSQMGYIRLILLTAVLAAQSLGEEAPEPVFRSDAPLVELHATVAGPDGILLTNLPQSAFQVLEDGIPQQIKVFRQEDAPVSIGLIVDNSASMRDKRARVSAAVLTLIRASNPGDEAFVLNFNEKPSLVRDFTQDPAQLESALARIDSNGETALRDALAMGIQHLNRLAKNDKKVLVVVSDGEDNSSTETLAGLSRAALKSGVLIYAIGLLSDADERETAQAKRDLDTLATGSGGQAFYPRDLGDVDDIATHVAHDLRSQYTLAYSPSNQKPDGKFRRIQVIVTAPEATVRTRAGYYASEP